MKKTFTLIELLVVIAIIAILHAIRRECLLLFPFLKEYNIVMTTPKQ